MDAAEHLAGLVDQAGRSLPQVLKGGSSRAIDRWQPEQLQGEVALPPGPLAGQSGAAALQAWHGGTGFIHPGSAGVAVDAGGGEIAQPLQRQVR